MTETAYDLQSAWNKFCTHCTLWNDKKIFFAKGLMTKMHFDTNRNIIKTF